MLKQRLIVIIVMLPVLILMGLWGGLPYALFVSIVMGVAAWEFWRMFFRGGYAPSAILTIGGATAICLQSYFQVISFQLVLIILLLLAALVHMVDFERGQKNAVLGFCITLAGSMYWGILGSYMIYLRMLPDGFWWLMLALPAVWASDSGGYLVGSKFGKHHMTTRLSPKKTWEGYVGGIVFAVIATSVLGGLWHARVDQITWQYGLILGAIIAILVPVGDFAASMFKRFFSLKDSSKLIPGHGGVIDRIDTWVWAAVLGYYFVLLVK